MDTTLIKPEHEKFRTFYASHMAFCEGNACAAGLLDFFDRFHSMKLEQQKSNRKYNDVAEQHGDGRSQDERLFQSHTQEALVNYLMGIFSINVVAKALTLLVDKKIITLHKNPNPKYQFDKTTHYLFHPEIFNDWIKNNHYAVVDSRNVNPLPRSHGSEGSMVPNQSYRSHRSVAAIDNLDLNKEKNLTLNLAAEQETIASERTSGLVTGCFFENKTINEKDKPAGQTIQSDQAVSPSFGSIGHTLTAAQHSELQGRFQRLQQTLKGKLSAPQAMFEEITYCLLDKTALSNCDNDFHRKLCCIEELIMKGKWRTPYGFKKACPVPHLPREVSLRQEELQAVLEHIRELQQAIAGDKAFAALLPETSVNAKTRALIDAQNRQRQSLLQTLLSKKQQCLEALSTEEKTDKFEFHTTTTTIHPSCRLFYPEQQRGAL